MTADEIGKKYVALVKAGKREEVLATLFSQDAVQIAPQLDGNAVLVPPARSFATICRSVFGGTSHSRSGWSGVNRRSREGCETPLNKQQVPRASFAKPAARSAPSLA